MTEPWGMPYFDYQRILQLSTLGTIYSQGMFKPHLSRSNVIPNSWTNLCSKISTSTVSKTTKSSHLIRKTTLWLSSALWKSLCTHKPGGLLLPKLYMDVPAEPRKFNFLYINFSPNYPPISIPFSIEKHPILSKIGWFLQCFAQNTPNFVNLGFCSCYSRIVRPFFAPSQLFVYQMRYKTQSSANKRICVSEDMLSAVSLIYIRNMRGPKSM